MHTVNSVWTGSDNRPGVVYDVDISGDGTVDCELVGDGAADGTTQDVHLSKGVDDFPDSDVGRDYGNVGESGGEGGYIYFDPCEKEAPSNYGWADDKDLSSLASFHGDLDDWAADFNDFAAETNPGGCLQSASRSAVRASVEVVRSDCPPDVARVVYTGVDTEGRAQTGALSSVDVGLNHYVFPSLDGTPRAASGSSVADVTGHFTAQQHAHRVTVTLTSDATPSGFTAGNNLVWTYTVTGRAPGTISQTAGRTDQFTVTNQRHINRAGNHVFVTVYKNGVKVGVFVVVPRPHHRHHHSG